MKNPTRGELLDIIQVTWKLKEGSRLFLKDVVCFGVPWTAWCQGFYSCDSFGFMRSGRCWKSCNKRTRFGAGCFPRLPWSFSTFGRIFSQAPKKSSGNSHPRPKPAQVPLPGNSVFFFGLGGKQPGWPWKITRMFFFQRDNFLIFFFWGGVGKQNRSKGFFGENDGISIFVVGRDFGSCRFCFKSLEGMMQYSRKMRTGCCWKFCHVLFWSLDPSTSRRQLKGGELSFSIPGSFLKDQQIAFEKVVGKKSVRWYHNWP